MVLVKDLYVIAHFSGDLWKDTLYTKEEAEAELIIAKKEYSHPLNLISLSEHFKDLIMSYY